MKLKNAFVQVGAFRDENWNAHLTATEAVLASYGARLYTSLRCYHPDLTEDQIKLIVKYVQGNRRMIYNHLSDLLEDAEEARKLDEARYAT